MVLPPWTRQRNRIRPDQRGDANRRRNRTSQTRSPTRVAGGSIKPGVERSGTPGSLEHKKEEPAKWATA